MHRDQTSIPLRPSFSLCCGLNLQDQTVAELQVWEESVPMLRSMLEEAMEQKSQLQAEKEDCTRLRQGLALTWVPDAAVHKCLNCEVAFSIRKWKNHCRCSAFSRPFLPASACLLLRFVHAGDVAGIAAVSFAGTAPAASWKFGASARRCSSRCSCFVSRAQNLVHDAARLMLCVRQGTRVQL